MSASVSKAASGAAFAAVFGLLLVPAASAQPQIITLEPPAAAEQPVTDPAATPAGNPTSNPEPLLPPGAQGPTEPMTTPDPAAPGPMRITPATPIHPSGRQGFSGGIMTGELDQVDQDAIGLLNGMNGGFGVDMWRGTPRRTIVRALPHLPVDTLSPAMHNIMKRLLLTVAPLPRAQSAGDAAPQTPLRLQQLVALGETADALRLYDLIPAETQNDVTRRAHVDALFIEGQTDNACAEVRAAIGHSASAYWQKAAIACQLLAGNIDQATIGLDLLRESGHDDPAFFAGAEGLMGLRVLSLSSLPNPTPAHIALLAAGKKPLPEDVLKAGPGIQRAVALNTNISPDIRVRAAERAVALNILEPKVLTDIYASMDFTAEEKAQPLSIATGPDFDPLRARALLYLAVAAEPRAAGQAELINAALTIAAKDGAFTGTARVYASTLASMPRAVELSWFAGQAARALYAAGVLSHAESWFELARTNSFASSDASRSANTLQPLARLAKRQWSLPWPADGLANWRDAQPDVPAATLDIRETVLLNLLLAFGEPLSGSEWEGLMGADPLRTAQVPSAAVWHALEFAASQKRIGETVMLSMTALGGTGGGGGPARAAAITLHHVVKALLAVGLETEARMLALEAALASGA